MPSPSTDRGTVPPGLTITVLLIILLWGVIQARVFLIPVCIATLLAFLMAPIVTALRKARVPELLAITITALLILLPFLVFGFLLVGEIKTLALELPKMAQWLDKVLRDLAHSTLGRKLEIPESFDFPAIGSQIAGSIGESAQIVLHGLQKLLEAGSHLALVLLFAVVMVASRAHLARIAERMFVQFEGIKSAAVLDEVVTLIEKFLIARLVIVLVVGTLGVSALTLFGIKYSFVLGAYLGIATLVPIVGYFSGVVLAVCVALATGHGLLSVFFLVIALSAIGIFESHLLTPKYIGKSLNINVLFTFLGLFAGELMWGIWGMLLSIPALGILRIAFSAVPSLQIWGELLAEREDKGLKERLSRRAPKKSET